MPYKPPEVIAMDEVICTLENILKATYQIPEWMRPPKEILRMRWRTYLAGEGAEVMERYLKVRGEK